MSKAGRFQTSLNTKVLVHQQHVTYCSIVRPQVSNERVFQYQISMQPTQTSFTSHSFIQLLHRVPKKRSPQFLAVTLSNLNRFLPRDASAERGYEIAFICPSVCRGVIEILDLRPFLRNFRPLSPHYYTVIHSPLSAFR